MKTKLLKNSYVLPMTLFCSALTFSPLGVAQAHATTNVVQQAKTVKGTVVDETGEPVIGASVMVKGTSVGCATDLDGNFTLQNVKPEQTLTISYIGYTAQTIAIGQQTNFNVVLKPDNKVLNEVVVLFCFDIFSIGSCPGTCNNKCCTTGKDCERYSCR